MDGDRAAALLAAAAKRSARLAAQWMAAGFVHGVLNTDNLVVTGESFDYGPWRFLPHFEPGFTAAYFDQTGLYAYARQPESVFWALQQLAGALTLVGDRDAIIAALSTYPDHYRAGLIEAFHRRLGLEPLGTDDDAGFVTGLLDFMKESEVSWEGFFFDWFCGDAARADSAPRAKLYADKAFNPIRSQLQDRRPIRPERLRHRYFDKANPVHMTIEQVEGLWAPIADTDDWSAFGATLEGIAEARAGYDIGAGRVGFLAEAER